jgi:hypothetical protein
MSTTDALLENNERYASSFDKGDLPPPPGPQARRPRVHGRPPRPCARAIKDSPFVPRTDSVRGFVYEVETGRLREVTWGGPQAGSSLRERAPIVAKATPASTIRTPVS